MLLIVCGINVISGVGIAFMDKLGEQEAKMLFGAKVRHLRQGRGMSQKALALACNLDRTYVGGVERGKRNISLITIHKLSRALGVPVKELF